MGRGREEREEGEGGERGGGGRRERGEGRERLRGGGGRSGRGREEKRRRRAGGRKKRKGKMHWKNTPCKVIKINNQQRFKNKLVNFHFDSNWANDALIDFTIN